jgi:hypothetical protein
MNTQNSKPELLFLLLCDLVIEDKFTDVKSFIGIRHSIQVAQLPTDVPRLFVVSSVQGTWSGILEFTVALPDSDKILQMERAITLNESNLPNDMVVEIVGLPLHKEGVHRFALSLDGVEIGYRDIPVSITSDFQIG